MINVITTVGTSIFENFLKKNDSIKTNYDIIINKPFNAKEHFQSEIKQIKQQIVSAGLSAESSAELKSLTAIIKDHKSEKFTIYPICTDTIVSFVAAEILKDSNLSGEKIKIEEQKVIAKLSLENAEDFKERGLVNLSDEINQIFFNCSREKENNENIVFIFNLTGGYKGLIPYLTLLAQLNECEINYIYETTDTLIKIPQLPVQFDPITSEKFYNALYSFKNGQQTLFANDVKEELLNLDFLKLKDEKTIITGLGHIFMTLTEKNMIAAKNVLGFIVEYKLFEYFVRNADNYFPYIELGNEDLNQGGNKKKGGEIDVLMKKSKESSINDSVIIEVKPLFQVLKEVLFEKVHSQFEKKLILLQKHNLRPAEIRFIFYTADKSMYNSTTIPNYIKENLQTLKKTAGHHTIRFFILFTDLRHKKSYNPYNAFLQEKFENTNIKEITI